MNLIFKNVSNIIICVGAGGGSGTGSCKVFADTCCQWIYTNNGDYSNTKVGFLIALPARSESSKVLSNTKLLLDNILNEKYSPIIFVDNQRITQAVKANALNRWNQANALVCSLFDVFNTLSAQETSLDTFDPKDFSDVLSHGIMTMAISSVPESSLKIGEESELARDTILSDKVKQTLKNSLLLQDVDISTATHASVLISCRKQALEQMDGNTIPKLSETLLSMMGNEIDKQVTLHRGIYINENIRESKIRIFLMFSGMKFPLSKMNEYENAVQKS
jgi:cell division GTPase FtsZ